MNDLAIAMLYFLGLAFVPLLIPLTAAAVGAVSDLLRQSKRSPAQSAVDEARRRSAVRRGEPVSGVAAGLD